MVLQEFSFGNYRSFKDVNTINLSAAKIKSKHKEIDENNVIKGKNIENVSFLKSKAIYGANASGKSNIIKAFATFLKVIRDSVKDDSALHLVDSFQLSTETENEPSFFQMIFWEDGVKYRYGFEVTDKTVESEWLFGKPNERELPYFIREGGEILELDKTNFSEGRKLELLMFDEDDDQNEVFRQDSLFLSTLATFGFAKLSKKIIEGFSTISILSGLGTPEMYMYAGEALNDNATKNYIMNILRYGDIGIRDVDAVEIPSEFFSDETDKSKKRKVLVSKRKKFDDERKQVDDATFPFYLYESEGTQKLFELSPYIFDAINQKRILIIDEFDARFHPLLTRSILSLFNSNNNKGAQLIFTTHDTHLLSPEILRRDQVEFVEKDKYGSSHSYSLIEFKGIRNNASFEKDYIQGKYGAIPFLGDFKKMLTFE